MEKQAPDFSSLPSTRKYYNIGELGFLLNIPRTATLIAQEPTLLLHVKLSVDQLFADHPELAKKMLVMLAERLVKTTEDWREAARTADVL